MSVAPPPALFEEAAAAAERIAREIAADPAAPWAALVKDVRIRPSTDEYGEDFLWVDVLTDESPDGPLLIEPRATLNFKLRFDGEYAAWRSVADAHATFTPEASYGRKADR